MLDYLRHRKNTILPSVVFFSLTLSSTLALAGVDDDVANLEPILGTYGVSGPSSGPISNPNLPASKDCDSTNPGAPGFLQEVADLQSVDQVIGWAFKSQSRFLPQSQDTSDEAAIRHGLRLQIASKLDTLYRKEHLGSVNTVDQVDQYDLWRLSNALQRKTTSSSSFKSRLLDTLRIANLNQKAADIAEKAEQYTADMDAKGILYKYGADSATRQDCSAFIGRLADFVADVKLPRSTAEIQKYIGKLKDSSGNHIAVTDPRQIPVGEVFVMAYGQGSGVRSHHTVALLRYPDSTVKVFESTRHKGHSGPQTNNYGSIDSFLKGRKILVNGKIKKKPIAGALDQISKIQHPG